MPQLPKTFKEIWGLIWSWTEENEQGQRYICITEDMARRVYRMHYTDEDADPENIPYDPHKEPKEIKIMMKGRLKIIEKQMELIHDGLSVIDDRLNELENNKNNG